MDFNTFLPLIIANITVLCYAIFRRATSKKKKIKIYKGFDYWMILLFFNLAYLLTYFIKLKWG